MNNLKRSTFLTLPAIILTACGGPTLESRFESSCEVLLNEEQEAPRVQIASLCGCVAEKTSQIASEEEMEKAVTVFETYKDADQLDKQMRLAISETLYDQINDQFDNCAETHIQ